MVRRNYLCKLNNKELQKVQKNPHTIQFFCDIENILNCDNNDCDNQQGYKYSVNFKGPEYDVTDISLPKILIQQKSKLMKIYNKTKIIETLNKVPYIKYYPRQQRPSTTIQWGQLKLFVATLQFLLYYAPKNKEVHIVYAGSADGYNIHIISELFPHCYWYLIDPRKHDPKLYNNKQVKKIEKDYFTEDMAKKYKKLLENKYTLFISDIRIDTSEKAIYNDNLQQLNWTKTLNANYSQLKFRIPRMEEKYQYPYIKGIIYLQSYEWPASTETRLVVKRNAPSKTYDINIYEGKLYYHNRILRVCKYKHNTNMNGIDRCYDCTLFVNLIKKYKKKYLYKKSMSYLISDIIKKLNKKRNMLVQKTNDIRKKISS